jgi:hypothetical protein
MAAPAAANNNNDNGCRPQLPTPTQLSRRQWLKLQLPTMMTTLAAPAAANHDDNDDNGCRLSCQHQRDRHDDNG